MEILFQYFFKFEWHANFGYYFDIILFVIVFETFCENLGIGFEKIIRIVY